MDTLKSIKPYGDSVHEECGVFGIYSQYKVDVASKVYYGLYALQHRGQEAAGIAVQNGKDVVWHRNTGLVSEVFGNGELSKFPPSNYAVGHVRYSATGETSVLNCQPVIFTGKCGKIAIAHNGNIANAAELREQLIKDGVIFQTTVDTEVIAALINKYSGEGGLVEGVKQAAALMKGAYTLIIMSGEGMIVVRDPRAIRPMCIGKIGENITVVASESCGLDAVRAKFLRDVKPGEILVIDKEGMRSEFLPEKKPCLCIFEYIYLARPDSTIDNCSVYHARQRSGELLAEKYPVDADVVAGVPDSGLVAAEAYAKVSGLPFVEALTKNRYVGRTFIQPEQAKRESSVGIKLNAMRYNVEGKRVVLLDDSIVRGTTSKKIIEALREAGAKEIHLRSCSPIIKHPCYFGVDMQTYDQLIGAYLSKEEIREQIGCDSLEFLSVPELVQTCDECDLDFCLACFDGNYPMEFARAAKKEQLKQD